MRILEPTAAEAAPGIRAVATVARTRGAIAVPVRNVMTAAQRHVLHMDFDVDALEPISPEEVAAAVVRPETSDAARERDARRELRGRGAAAGASGLRREVPEEKVTAPARAAGHCARGLGCVLIALTSASANRSASMPLTVSPKKRLIS